MKVVWHNHIGIQFDIGANSFRPAPFFIHDLAPIVKNHVTISYHAKYVVASICTDGHKVCARGADCL